MPDEPLKPLTKEERERLAKSASFSKAAISLAIEADPHSPDNRKIETHASLGLAEIVLRYEATLQALESLPAPRTISRDEVAELRDLCQIMYNRSRLSDGVDCATPRFKALIDKLESRAPSPQSSPASELLPYVQHHGTCSIWAKVGTCSCGLVNVPAYGAHREPSTPAPHTDGDPAPGICDDPRCWCKAKSRPSTPSTPANNG